MREGETVLEPYRTAIAARVGTALESALLLAGLDALCTADEPRERLDDLNLVAAHFERAPHVPGEALLHHNMLSKSVLEAWSLDGLLDVHPVFENVHEHLWCRLQDAEPAGRTDAQMEFAFLECLGRCDDEIHLLPGADLVRTALFQLEV